MYALERDHVFLVEIDADTITEAKKIADEQNCSLYKDNKLIYIPGKNQK